MLPLIVAGPLLTVTATFRPLDAVGGVIEKDEAPGVFAEIEVKLEIVWVRNVDQEKLFGGLGAAAPPVSE